MTRLNLTMARGAALLALVSIASPLAAAPRFKAPRLPRPQFQRAPAFAPAAPAPSAAPDKATMNLVRKMLQAQNNLALEGTMVTETALGTFVQHAIMDGARAQRFECLSPPANRGEVIIDDGRTRYHTVPNGKTETQPSQMAQRRVRVPEVMQEIRQGGLLAQQIGEGTVAGHDCAIVRVGPPYAADWYQYWIDPDTGAQLQIEEYDSSGRRLSATYFTDVTYNPTINPALFAAPDNAPARKPRVRPQQNIPTSAQAGFSVLQPSFLPAGFQFQSSVVRSGNAGNVVRLVYGNGLDALSLFETPDTRPEGPKAGLVKTPRPGVVTLRRDGLVIVLVGSLDVPTMQSVITSLR